MGNNKSSPRVETSGNKDTTIINTQEFITELHDAHALKLWIILVVVPTNAVISEHKSSVITTQCGYEQFKLCCNTCV